MGRYSKLSAYLNEIEAAAQQVRFSDIEEMLGLPLPVSARHYHAWWSNDATPGRQSNAWMSVGWKTEQVDLAGERVTFRRGPPGPAGSRSETHTADAEPSALTNTPPVEALADAPDGAIPIAIGVLWKELGAIALDAACRLVFPATMGLPGLYRIRLLGSTKPRHYIGETVDLRQRFQHYRTPGPSQATNQRINALLLSHLSANGQAVIDIITGDITLIVGGKHRTDDLSDEKVRRLLEQAALIAEGGSDTHSLNR